jgi:hypothetical protein
MIVTHGPNKEAQFLPNKPSITHQANEIVDKTEDGLLSPLGRSSKWHIWLQCLLHVPSVVITMGVLSLTFRGIFWQGSGPEMNSVLNALQFAAKIHESLIIVSLSAMVVHRLNLDLMGGRGVPVGLLSSGYQLNSIAYIFSLELWGGFFGRRCRRLQGLPLTILVVVALVMGALSGPSSAITMIPKLDWWPLLEITKDNMVRYEAYMEAPAGPLFPTNLTAGDVPDYCFDTTEDSGSYCPSAGFSRLITDPVFMTTITMPYMAYASTATNLTMSINGSGIVRYLSGAMSPVIYGVFVATTVPDFVASVLAWYWTKLQVSQHTISFDAHQLQNAAPRPMVRASLGPGSLSFQKPLVTVQCKGFPPDTEAIEFPHDQLWYLNQGAFADAVLSVPTSKVFNITGAGGQNEETFVWVDLDELSGVKPSLGAIFVQSPKPGGNPNSIYACTLDAHWVPVNAWIDPSFDSVVHESFTAAVKVAFDSGIARDPGDPRFNRIQLDPSWANSLNVIYDTSKGNSTTTMETIGTYCSDFPAKFVNGSDTNPASMLSRCLGTGLGLYVTDGISRLRNSLPTYVALIWQDGSKRKDILPLPPRGDINYAIIKSQNMTYEELQDPAKYIRLHLPVYRYGYGYGLRGITIYVATTVLLVHVFLCFIHITSMLSSKSVSKAWDTMSEMLVLAINSPPTEESRNAAIDSGMLSTWGKLLHLRETTDDKVALVLDRHAPNDSTNDTNAQDNSGIHY